VPELQNLSEEQLEAGEGVDLIREKFDGAAKAMGDTATGALQQLSNTFGDFQEQIGETIATGINPLVSSINNYISRVTEGIEQTKLFNETVDQFETREDPFQAASVEELENRLAAAKKEVEDIRQKTQGLGFATQEQKRAEAVVEELQRQLEVQRRLAEKENERQQILQKYGDTSEEYKNLQEEIAALEEKASTKNSEALEKLTDLRRNQMSQQEREIAIVQEKIDKWAAVRDRLRDAGQEYGAIQSLLNELVAKRERLNEVEGEGKNILSEMRDISAEWHSERMAQIQEEIDRMEALHEKYGALAPEVKRIQDAWNKWGEQVYGVTTRTYSALMSLQENQHNQEIQALEEEIQQRKENGKDTTELEKKKQEKINQFRKEQWEREKQGKLLQATISTAQAVAEALPSLALAATVGALGAVQIGAIAATENPYYKGGVIEEPVMGVGQKTGETYSFGERGPETVTPGRNKGQSTRITVNLDRRVILDAVSKGTQNGEVIVDQRAVR
jgi:hypothetical protein